MVMWSSIARRVATTKSACYMRTVLQRITTRTLQDGCHEVNYVTRRFRWIPYSTVFGVSTLFVAQMACCEPSNIDASKSMNKEEVEHAEALYAEHKYEEVHQYLLQYESSDDPELLWRLARAMKDRAEMSDLDKEDKKRMIFESLATAKRAVEAGDDNFACHKWYGIMLSKTGDYDGTRAKLENSPLMREHFQKALALNPLDSTSHHLMGMWCFSFADLAWYERRIASVVFATVPESSYDEALQHFLKAEEVQPDAYSTTQLMIAQCYQKLGRHAEAKHWFEKLSSYICHRDEDRDNVARATEEFKSM